MTGTEAYRRAPPNLRPGISNTKARQQMAPEASTKGRIERGGLITTSLPSLQNLIKRSPESYVEEFQVQWARWKALVNLVEQGLGGAKGDEEKLREVTNFVCQVRRYHFRQIEPSADNFGEHRSLTSTRP